MPLRLGITSFTITHSVLEAKRWPLPSTMSRHRPQWRYWGPCPITPRLYVVSRPYSAFVYSPIISIDYYRYLQWRVEDAEVPGLQSIVPLKDDTLQACWGADQSVGVAPAAGYVWVIAETENGYKYVTRTS